MTDPVEALARVYQRNATPIGGYWPPIDPFYEEAERDIAALRASGFDVVPTPPPSGDVDANEGIYDTTGPFSRESLSPSGDVDALLRLADQWEADRHLTREDAVRDLRQAAYAIPTPPPSGDVDAALVDAIREAVELHAVHCDDFADLRDALARLSSSDTDR